MNVKELITSLEMIDDKETKVYEEDEGCILVSIEYSDKKVWLSFDSEEYDDY